MRSTIRHILPTDTSTFWKDVFFDQEYTQRMYSEVLGMGRVEMLEQAGCMESEFSRRLRCSSGVAAFASLTKKFGVGMSVVEEGIFRLDRRGVGRWRFNIIPSSYSEKVSVRGELHVKVLRPGLIESVFDIDYEVSIFGMGRMAEGLLKKAVTESFGKVAVFTEEFIHEKGFAA